MQYASPADIYNQPAATFVAGFTGSPPMNLVPCTLEGNTARVGGIGLELPAHLRGKSASQTTFGIRPENILLAPGQDTVAVPARVVITEPLGAETLVTLQIGSQSPVEMVSRASAQFAQRAGDNLTVHLERERIHLFDAQSGMRL
jgi:multiple sugar transport system ATP-binding protein